MTNLLVRIKDTIMADLYDVLEKKEDKNPEVLLNQYLRECEAETEKVKKLLERQEQLKEQFSAEYRQASEMAEKRTRQAEIAEKAGEMDLAIFAVKEQLQYAERAEHLRGLLINAGKELETLERKYEEMKHKLKDMQIRRLEYMGRENAVNAHKRINSMIGQSGSHDEMFSRLEKMEAYLDTLEDKLAVTNYRNTIDSRIAELEEQLKKQETPDKN